MLDNSSYDKVKLLHELSCLDWFIEKHAIKDAQSAGDAEFEEALSILKKDLERHIEKIRGMVCTITQ
jgi:hypothetical protein